CTLSIPLCCPICDTPFIPQESPTNPTTLSCHHCRNITPILRIKNIIESGMSMDHNVRCPVCNGPTIHRRLSNIGHRCFFFPKCSGQGDLFGNAKESITFLDFETTGLNIGKDSIIEIGALKIDEDGLEHSFQTMVKPATDLPDHITKITSITNDMVKEAPSLQKSMTQLNAFIGTSKLVAHNTAFDIPWLYVSSLRYNIPITHSDIICTLKWAKACAEPKCSLTALSKKYKIGHLNAHRALADAAATKELFFIFEGFNQANRPIQAMQTYLTFSQKLVKKYSDHIQA
ncbi:MAG: 3'-5' exonuclease, partial [Candidatus Margulisbacteria bacterium]|nr:3'-5' exonuclease [Candidatus Margulisiibacteriota bacterium]